MTKKEKRDAVERPFFENKNGYIEYNNMCCRCENTCRQSHKVIIIACPKYREIKQEKSKE